MSWAARIEHVDGGLAISFAEPVSRLVMTNDTAAHFAGLLALEARSQVVGVVRELEGEACRNVNHSPKTSTSHPLCCDCDACLNGDHHHA